MLNCIRVCETRSTETRLTRVLMRTLSSISIFFFREEECPIVFFSFQGKCSLFSSSTWKIVNSVRLSILITDKNRDLSSIALLNSY